MSEQQDSVQQDANQPGEIQPGEIQPSAVQPRAIQPEAEEPPPEREFEDFSLAEAVSLLRRRPISTLNALIEVARAPSEQGIAYRAEAPSIFAPPAKAAPQTSSTSDVCFVPDPDGIEEAIPQESAPPVPSDIDIANRILPGIRLSRFALRLVALLIALIGGYQMVSAPIRSDTGYLDNGFPLVVAAFLIWWLGETLPFFSRLVRRVPRHANNSDILPYRCDDMAVFPLTVGRVVSLLVTFAAAIGAYVWNGGNEFTTRGVIAWVVAIAAAVWTLAPENWSPLSFLRDLFRSRRPIRIEITPSLLALIFIIIVGAYFRLYDQAGTPPEMTSDHVEKLLDTQGIFDGRTNVFFANNGGREAIQFYYLAVLKTVTGLPLDFDLLKLGTALEGILTLPVLYWMGRELIGRRDRRLGEIVGLLMAAFVAVSAWHVVLSRLGLRIVITPLFTALGLCFLVRGLRYNRRWDFIYLGIALGFGFYGYQALRAMPLVVIAGGLIGLVVGAQSMRVRLTLLGNLAASAVIAAIIFVPLYRFSIDYPDQFWNRTSGRLLGDAITQTTDENGNLVRREPTLQEEIDALVAALPNLTTNVRNALLMYTWKGDVAWFQNVPNKPALDAITGGLLIVGLAAWLARSARRGDPGDWVIVPAILILMLPSILSLAFPIENPSHTRMSGTLPGIYLLVALPLALVALELRRLIGRFGAVLGVVASVVLIGFSFSANAYTYFTEYRASYMSSALPYSVGGKVMYQFAVVDENGYGNVFHLAYPYWWDHRALAIEGGNIRWNNSILRLEDIPQALRSGVTRDPSDPMRLDPNHSLLFFLSTDDSASREWLTENFPTGALTTVSTYLPRTFDIYLAPAPGYAELNRIFLNANLDPVAEP